MTLTEYPAVVRAHASWSAKVAGPPISGGNIPVAIIIFTVVRVARSQSRLKLVSNSPVIGF